MITGFDGLDNYIMNSSQEADLVIAEFQWYADMGCDLEDIEREVWQNTGVNPADLTEYDKQRILDAVNRM